MIWLSPLIEEVLAAGADCAIGVSGGKDSQALLITIVTWFRAQGYTGKIFAIFADLGRAEWLQTRSFIEHLCQSLEIELIVVKRAQGDLLDLIRSLCWLEIQSGYSFQSNRWLCDIVPTLLTDEMRFLLEQHPRRQQWRETQRQKTGRKARKILPVLT